MTSNGPRSKSFLFVLPIFCLASAYLTSVFFFLHICIRLRICLMSPRVDSTTESKALRSTFIPSLARIFINRGAIWAAVGRRNLRTRQWLLSVRIFGELESLQMQMIGTWADLMILTTSCIPPRSEFPDIPSTSSITSRVGPVLVFLWFINSIMPLLQAIDTIWFSILFLLRTSLALNSIMLKPNSLLITAAAVDLPRPAFPARRTARLPSRLYL
mmetsp:Transcript_31876/g.55989  ORF Transcript_31876/g.55989 Transcript_31876/m.55989 type:complete len:215 (-) Transcript_31876:422-1066(-)